MLADKFPMRRGDATEILRPGPVKPAVDNDMADLLFPQLLGNWGKADQGVDLFLGEKLHRLRRGINHEFNIAFWIDSDVSGDAGEEHIMRRHETWHGDRAPLEVVNSPHALGTEQLEASGVDAAEQHDR